MHIRHLIILATLATAGCSHDPVVTIANESSLTLSNVVVSGSGFSESIGSIAAGGQHSLAVRPQGDSGIRLVFDEGTNRMDSGNLEYFEANGAYRVTVVVSTNLDVTVSSDLK